MANSAALHHSPHRACSRPACALALGCSDAATIRHLVTAADLTHARTEIIEVGEPSRRAV
jgi:hypothetical protein